MPTAVLDVELTDLPARLAVDARYERAFVLVRWGGVPVLVDRIPVRDGAIAGSRLQERAFEHAAGAIARARARAYLELPASTRPMPATVAVCTRDRVDDLARCLAALARLPDDGQDVLIVDSASGDSGTRDLVGRYPQFRYLREDRPGLDRARNRAIESAAHDVIAFTDDDATPDPAWLRALGAGFTDPRTAVVTGLTLPLELETEAQEWFESTNGFGRGLEPRDFDGLECDPFRVAAVGAGVNMAVRRSALAVVGPFAPALDAGTPTRSGGDHELFGRVLGAGYGIRYRPDAISWHRHRREWPEVRDAIYGYGVGVYASLTRRLLAGETAAPLIALRWLPAQLGALARGIAGRPGATPVGLTLTELSGCLAGPLAYWRSTRLARDGG